MTEKKRISFSGQKKKGYSRLFQLISYFHPLKFCHNYIQTKKRRNPSLERSKQVKKEVLDKLKEVIENL